MFCEGRIPWNKCFLWAIWLSSRLGLVKLAVLLMSHKFPSLFCRLLNSAWFESWEIIGPYPLWGMLNGLLLTIQILHVFWSYFIICTAYKALVRGKVWVAFAYFYLLRTDFIFHFLCNGASASASGGRASASASGCCWDSNLYLKLQVTSVQVLQPV